jgi:hypothetical protein
MESVGGYKPHGDILDDAENANCLNCTEWLNGLLRCCREGERSSKTAEGLQEPRK